MPKEWKYQYYVGFGTGRDYSKLVRHRKRQEVAHLKLNP